MHIELPYVTYFANSSIVDIERVCCLLRTEYRENDDDVVLVGSLLLLAVGGDDGRCSVWFCNDKK